MNQKEFARLPWLLMEHQVVEVSGYARATVRKLADCGVLAVVKPAGCLWGRYRKKQVGQLLELAVGLEELEAFRREPMLMSAKRVSVMTGYSMPALERIVAAGGLSWVQPAGLGQGRFRKREVACLIGLGDLV